MKNVRSRIQSATSIIFILSVVLLCPPATFAQGRFTHVAINPTDSNTLYATSWDGVFKSADAGESWFEIDDGFPPHPSPSELDPSFLGSLVVRAFAFDPSDPQILYVGLVSNYVRLRDGRFITTPGGIFRSEDGGKNWAVFGTEGDRHNAYDLLIGSDSDTVYAATGVFVKATSGGSDWLVRGVSRNAWGGIAVDPRDSDTIYLGVFGDKQTPSAIFKSTNGGNDWIRTGFRLSVGSTPRIALDPKNPDTVYATHSFNYRGTYRSEDRGETWSQLTSLGQYCITFDPNDSNTLYVCDSYGVAKSTDRGETWNFYGTGLESQYIYSVAVDPNDSQIVYAASVLGNPTGGVFKSIDGGETWFALSVADGIRRRPTRTD